MILTSLKRLLRLKYYSGVSCEILNLLDIQPAFKQPCDVGMPELVRMNVEIQCADYLGVRRGCPEIGRIIDRAAFNRLPH